MFFLTIKFASSAKWYAVVFLLMFDNFFTFIITSNNTACGIWKKTLLVFCDPGTTICENNTSHISYEIRIPFFNHNFIYVRTSIRQIYFKPNKRHLQIPARQVINEEYAQWNCWYVRKYRCLLLHMTNQNCMISFMWWIERFPYSMP